MTLDQTPWNNHTSLYRAAHLLKQIISYDHINLNVTTSIHAYLHIPLLSNPGPTYFVVSKKQINNSVAKHNISLTSLNFWNWKLPIIKTTATERIDVTSVRTENLGMPVYYALRLDSQIFLTRAVFDSNQMCCCSRLVCGRDVWYCVEQHS